MKSILILKFPYSSSFGGGEIHTISLVRGLQQHGFAFYLATSCPVLIREFKKRGWSCQKVWGGVEPVSKKSLLLFPFTTIFVFLRLAACLFKYRYLKKVRIVYCQSLTEKILITPLAKLMGFQVFWVEHNLLDRWLTKNPLRIIYQLNSRLVTIIAISKAVKKQLLDLGVKEKNLKVIYPGVDLGKFDIVRRNFQKKFQENFIVGTISRLEPEKGITYLLQAVKSALPLIPNLSLLIVGDGSARQNLEWLTKKLEIEELTQFVGFQKATDRWYPLFDLFVLPSAIRESFGISLVEALSFEVPVIASRLGGIVEIIEDEKTGYLVPPKDHQALSEKIISVYKNYQQAKAVAQAGRQKVEQNYSLDKMISEHYQLFVRQE
ncbi:glycosyltransferase family 4 protein [Patescibacteria group bacterium]|nr:glycosyltransferase family 4 protein [Patescibacteria group bacterium]